MSADADTLRAKILALVAEYHDAAFPPRPFVPGETPVPVSGRVFGASDIAHLVDASLDFWLTTGRFAAQFERAFARVMGVRHALLVNSGSSANLVAVSTLTSPSLGDRRLRPGDEVITVASGFPTTVNPIVQNRLVPVFLDVHIPTYNIDVTQLEAGLSDRTRAIVVAHTLGNPFDLRTVTEFARKHDLFLVEDCCDAVGATYDGRGVGTFGDLATVSFYPAHHITMGEGGCVLTQKPAFKRIIESFRDWGRDCWCDPGKENTCGKRFEWQLGGLPCGYDHKYTYSHLGYNLKLTDMQAALGVAQLERLDDFIAARRRNFAYLREALDDLQDVLVLPEATPDANPSWFGFPILVREDAPFTRNEMVHHLESRRVATRLLFGGNLVRQPAYADVTYRQVGDLANSDRVMHGCFWVGVYPGLTEEMLDWIARSIREVVTAVRVG
ncbi:MAG TPA: lipopolysaccharide biosynthesis protein RfbH [Gemmatimonadaceae bacterium]|nr:lipopolysaccharide biosynthesis protein RfbH [Gemmatimonadaceae bacterium]